MKKIILLFLGISLLFSPSLVFGRSAADVIFYHYRTTPHHNSDLPNNTDHFPLYPQEQEMAGFPTPVSKNETDLAILQRYYETVATAYEEHLNKDLRPKLADYKLKIAGQQQKMHLTQSRLHIGKNQFSRHLTEGRGETTGQDRIEQKARVHAINYYSSTFKDLSDSLSLTEKKADFYRELAKISEDLYKGEIH